MLKSAPKPAFTDPNNVVIGGGSINNTPIGGTTTADGNFTKVGVGTTAPQTALHVVKAVTFSTIDTFGQMILKATSGAFGRLLNLGVDESGDRAIVQAVDRGVGDIPLVLQPYGGWVGIGITPTETFQTTGAIKTAAPAGGTSSAWRLGTVASVSPTAPNRTIEVQIGGTTYYLHAKTTND